MASPTLVELAERVIARTCINTDTGCWEFTGALNKGHPYDEGNTYTSQSGGRYCRACGRVANAKDYVRRRALGGKPKSSVASESAEGTL